MSNSINQMTAEKLASLPDDGCRRELVNGVLHMMSPAGGRHGRIAAKLLLRLGNHVERHRLGQTFAAETGYLLSRDPDTVRAPDVSFVSHTRLGEFSDYPGYLPLAPELAAEVISPNDEPSRVTEKVNAWLQAGARVVLVVDPERRVIREFRTPNQVREYSDDTLDLADVVPAFKLDVGELFE